VNKKQLTQIFARVTRRSPAHAADEIDGLVYRLLKQLKRPFIRQTKQRSTAAGSTGSKQER